MDPNSKIGEYKAATCDIRPGRRPRGPRSTLLSPTTASARGWRDRDRARPTRLALELRRRGARASRLLHRHQRLHRLQGVRGGLQGVEPGARGRRRAHWRVLRQHEQPGRQHVAPRRLRRATIAGGRAAGGDLLAAAATTRMADEAGLETAPDEDGFRWLMSSDVCKHCTQAACLEVAPPARCFARNSARWSCRRTSATAAGTASRPAPTACSISARATGACGSARSATTGSRTTWSPPARRPAPPTRSSLALTTSCSARAGALGEASRRGGGSGAALRCRPRHGGGRRRRFLPAARRP